jgi:glycosyltransferase involved in cell wall biosynthesis
LRVARAAGPARALAYFVEACRIQRHLRDSDVSHLHVHFGTNAATVALLIAAMGGPGFSLTVHGPDEFDAPATHMLAAKVAAARFAVGISDFTAAQLQRWSHPSEAAKIHVVRCAVDERFFAAARPIGAARQLVCVGRLCPQKGQLVLVKAFARLAAEDSTARLVLAGDGEMRSEIERAVASHGLESRIHLTGWVDESQVREHVLGSRCFVLPSFAEGLPVSIMEAFALGRPVISTYVAGIPELVRPGENGWLVPAGNVDALFAAMREALAAPDAQLEAFAAAGARAVRERHDIATEGARLEKLFQMAGS